MKIVPHERAATAAGVRRSTLGRSGVLLELSGEIGEDLVPLLRHELASAFDGGRDRFVVDLTRVTSLDPRAVRSLHAAAARATKVGGAIAVVCRDRPLSQVFAEHTDGLIAVRLTLTAAIDAVG